MALCQGAGVTCKGEDVVSLCRLAEGGAERGMTDGTGRTGGERILAHVSLVGVNVNSLLELARGDVRGKQMEILVAMMTLPQPPCAPPDTPLLTPNNALFFHLSIPYPYPSLPLLSSLSRTLAPL